MASRRLHWLPGLGTSTSVTLPLTFTDFIFTVCFHDISGLFSLERTDRGRRVVPSCIELGVPARRIAASNPVLCGRARPIGTFPSRQATNT
jgi:hypothetical protein